MPNQKPPVERAGLKAEDPGNYYTFGEEIGRGKMSVVKKVTCKTSGAKYAAKITKYDEESIKFGVREYDLMVSGNLEVNGTVGKLHEGFIVRKYLILIMELVEGKNILDHFAGQDNVTEEDVAQLIKSLVETLGALHERNVVHLDVRPTNIRMKGRDPVLLDYNSARHIVNKKTGEVVDIIGDTSFCAPEMLRFESVLPGSDMWSIGVLTYILLSGVNPFFYEDEDKITQSVQKVDYKFGDAFKTVSSEAKDFVKKMFVQKPEMRPTAAMALEHEFLKDGNSSKRKHSVIGARDMISKVNATLLKREKDDYVEASLVFRTFEEDEYESEDDE